MIPYILFVFFILFFRSIRKPFLIYLTLLLFSVLRFDTGWDYMSYYDTVVYWGDETRFSIERFSFIWKWVFETAQMLNMPHLALAIPGALTISLVYYAVTKIQIQKQQICDSLTVYALWPFFFLGSFSTVRQALAIAVGLVILYCALNRRYFGFVLLLIINVFIHPSSIVCAFYAAFFIKNFKLSNSQLILIVAAVVAGLFSLDVLLNNSFLGVYASYLESTDTYGSKLSILLALVLIPTLIIRKNTQIERGMIDICAVSLILLIITFTVLSQSILSRVAEYFTILLIFVAPRFKSLFSNKQLGGLLVFLAFVGIFFVYLFITKDSSADGLAASPFVPYKSILLR